MRSAEFWKYSASEYHKLLSPYVPFKTGALDETVRIKGSTLSGEIEYCSPYAHYQYEGKAMGPTFFNPEYGFWSPPGKPKKYNGRRLKYSKDGHSKATDHWDKKAEPTQKPKLIEAMQKYVDSGRLDLSD